MDAFKAVEIERMRLGGNARWREFFENHEDTKMRGLGWDDATIAERYSGPAGEEWKERLSAKVEGREYVPGEKKKEESVPPAARVRDAAALEGSRTASPNQGQAQQGGKAKVDDRYFAGLGAANASRPEDLPPSQGGKYAGFGSSGPMPQKSAGGNESLPGFDELQKDPMAALGKGFGWFTSTVGRTAQTVNKDFIQPTAKQIAASDFAAQARVAGATVARGAQQGARSAQDNFNKFVEGGPNDRQQYRQVPIDESKRDFWDDFSSIGEQQKLNKPEGSSSIGTAAMGKGSGGGSGATSRGGAAKKDDWDDW